MAKLMVLFPTPIAYVWDYETMEHDIRAKILSILPNAQIRFIYRLSPFVECHIKVDDIADPDEIWVRLYSSQKFVNWDTDKYLYD